MDAKTLHIITQVTRLYHRYGIKSVTMDDVAKRLGISKKTLYEHFSDKEDLVRQVILSGQEVFARRFVQIGGMNLNAIEEIFEVYRVLNEMFREYNPSVEFDVRKYYPDLYISIREARRKSIFGASLRNLRKGKSEGLFRKDLNTKIVAKLQMLRVETMIDSDIFTVEELTSAKVNQELLIYHLLGVLSQEGREFLQSNYHRLTGGHA